MWQQHVVTLKKESVKLGRSTLKAVTASGEPLEVARDVIVWLSASKGSVRLCYNKKVVTSGSSKWQSVSRDGNLVRLHNAETKTTILVNPKFHRKYPDTKD